MTSFIINNINNLKKFLEPHAKPSKLEKEVDSHVYTHVAYVSNDTSPRVGPPIDPYTFGRPFVE